MRRPRYCAGTFKVSSKCQRGCSHTLASLLNERRYTLKEGIYSACILYFDILWHIVLCFSICAHIRTIRYKVTNKWAKSQILFDLFRTRVTKTKSKLQQFYSNSKINKVKNDERMKYLLNANKIKTLVTRHQPHIMQWIPKEYKGDEWVMSRQARQALHVKMSNTPC